MSEVWDHCNKSVHSKDCQENMTKKLHLLRQEAKSIVHNRLHLEQAIVICYN